MTVTPAPREVAKAVTPMAIAESPAPIASRPAPMPTAPTPISANAPARPRIVGTNGVRIAPAAPMTPKAPATATSPLTMDSQLMDPRVKSTGVSTARAPAATRTAAEPAREPFISFKPAASSSRDTPKVTRPLATLSQLIPPILFKESATISSAAPTAIKPAPRVTMFLGISFVARATSASAPPIARRPLPISARDMFPKSAIAEANIFIAAPISIMARPVDMSPLALPVSFVNAVISRSRAPMELSPLTSSPIFICPKSLQAEANTFIALAKTKIPAAVVNDFPLNCAVFMKRDTSASKTPTPTRPFVSPARSS